MQVHNCNYTYGEPVPRWDDLKATRPFLSFSQVLSNIPSSRVVSPKKVFFFLSWLKDLPVYLFLLIHLYLLYFRMSPHPLQQPRTHHESLCPLSSRSPSITSDLTIMWTSETYEGLRRWSWLTEIQWRLYATMYCRYFFCRPCQSQRLSPNVWGTSKRASCE